VTIDKWGEFTDPPKDFDDFLAGKEEFLRNREADNARRNRRRRADEMSEVGHIPDPPPEIIERRLRYEKDISLIHEEIFKGSSGIKPLCEAQLDSCKHSQQWLDSGGKICKAEPRAFGKTSRSCNEAHMGVLQGKIPYLLILASTLEKAIEIATSIRTEMMENPELGILYTKVQECFLHHNKNTRITHQQSYNGKSTKISIHQDIIRFPVLEGEPSSGAVIQIRPKNNVRGIYQTIEAGPNAGKRLRPTHVLIDDIQTDEDAANPKRVAKIIKTLKRSVFRAGSHTKKIAVMMTCTPIEPGDVAHHFLLNEPGFQTTTYQMLESRALNETMWLENYASLLLNFNKIIPGDAQKAAQAATQYYKDNQKEMDEGAKATWEWCYEWDDDPQLEISAIQHAYNIIIIEGMDVFENECQCNVTAYLTDSEISFCSAAHISEHYHSFKRRVLPIDCTELVTHIDLGVEYFVATTIASPKQVTASIVDVETFPPYPGTFGKGKVSRTISHLFPHVPVLRDRLYLALLQFVAELARRDFFREDGIRIPTRVIGIDSSWQGDTVNKVCRESPYGNICLPMEGESYKAKDRQQAEKRYSEGSTKYHYCVEVPASDRMLRKLLVDVNMYKTQIHIMFEREVRTTGSLNWWQPEYPNQHYLGAEHCTAELPMMDVCPRTERKKVVWTQIPGRDNEIFDNLVASLALLSRQGCSFDIEVNIPRQPLNMQDYMNKQRKKP